MNNYHELDIKVPSLDDTLYKNMFQYQEYEFTYCIVYEMLLRNDDFYQLYYYEPQSDQESGARKLSLREYGVDEDYLNDYSDTLGTDILKINDGLLLGRFFTDFKIGNIKDGLFKLVKYYFKNNQLYEPIPDQKNYEITNRIVTGKTVAEIYINYDQYYIPIEYENEKTIVQLSTELSMHLLNESFLKTIQYSDFLVPYVQTEPIFKAPTLKFNTAKVINLPVNLNLPKNELIAYITKIKEDYDSLNYNPKRPGESIYEDINRLERPKSEKKVPQKMFENYREYIINALYIYDLNSLLQPIYNSKKEKLRTARDEEVKAISSDSNMFITHLKEGRIESTKDNYSNDIGKWSNEQLKEGISEHTGFSKDKVQNSLTLMKSYIDNMKYKVLITGSIEK